MLYTPRPHLLPFVQSPTRARQVTFLSAGPPAPLPPCRPGWTSWRLRRRRHAPRPWRHRTARRRRQRQPPAAAGTTTRVSAHKYNGSVMNAYSLAFRRSVVHVPYRRGCLRSHASARFKLLAGVCGNTAPHFLQRAYGRTLLAVASDPASTMTPGRAATYQQRHVRIRPCRRPGLASRPSVLCTRSHPTIHGLWAPSPFPQIVPLLLCGYPPSPRCSAACCQRWATRAVRRRQPVYPATTCKPDRSRPLDPLSPVTPPQMLNRKLPAAAAAAAGGPCCPTPPTCPP